MSKLKTIERMQKHFGRHFKKYCALVLCIGIAFPGYSFKSKWFSCGKESIKVKSTPTPGAE